ncbi:MAG: hypothetical protein E7315_04735 [Clostridiales bacterium]|nr:hypothetical protein [Clostridiales bacterium]
MKKIVVLILVIVMCLSLTACSGGTSGGIIGKDVEGKTCIKSSKFGSLIERVELTLENWKDYISLVTYDVTTIERDPFGDIISQTTQTKYLVGVKTDRFYTFAYNGTAIELQNKSTGEKKIYSHLEYRGIFVDETFNLDDYECTRIQGYIYFVDIPDEVITQSQYQMDRGTGSVSVGNSSFNWIISLDLNARVIEAMEYNLDGYLK